MQAGILWWPAYTCLHSRVDWISRSRELLMSPELQSTLECKQVYAGHHKMPACISPCICPNPNPQLGFTCLSSILGLTELVDRGNCWWVLNWDLIYYAAQWFSGIIHPNGGVWNFEIKKNKNWGSAGNRTRDLIYIGNSETRDHYSFEVIVIIVIDTHAYILKYVHM
jgi:hypothetical protein